MKVWGKRMGYFNNKIFRQLIETKVPDGKRIKSLILTRL